MKIKLLLIWICFTGTVPFVSGQVLKIDTSSGNLLVDHSAEAQLHFLMRNEYSRMAIGNNNASIGNYVAFSTTDNNLDFKYSFLRKKHIWEITAGAGVSDNIATFFSSGELNTGVKLGVNYTFFCSKNGSATFSSTALSRIIDRDNKLIRDKDRAYLELDAKPAKVNKVVAEKRKEMKELDAKIDQASMSTYFDNEKQQELETKLHYLQRKRDLLTIQLAQFDQVFSKKLAALKQDIDSTQPGFQERYAADSAAIKWSYFELKADLKKTADALETTQLELKANTVNQENLQQLHDRKKVLQGEVSLAMADSAAVANEKNRADLQINDELTQARIKNIETLSEIYPLHIRMSWFSIGGAIKNENFTHFDPSLAQEDQFSSVTDLVPELKASWNYYSKRTIYKDGQERQRITMFLVSGQLRYGNNFKELTQVEVQTTNPVSANRNSVATKKAYEGTFLDNQVTAGLTGDYYQYFSTKARAGFHLQASLDVGPYRPVTSVRGGLLFAALKAGDDTSVANFEVFLALNNIFKPEDEKNLFSRNLIGIQTTLPFNFNSK